MAKSSVTTAKSSKRTFKQLSNVEHVRLRTGMWLGQNSLASYPQHFFIRDKEGRYKIISAEVTDIPAKWKCLDEVCMNAVDEFNRNRIDKSLRAGKKMSALTITLHANRKRITVSDNGRGIPYKNAEKVFLHLMYGENFDDAARKEHIAGQNGVGVSLVRIVSKYFYAETCYENILYRKLFTIEPAFRLALEKAYLSTELEKAILKSIEEQGTFTHLPAFQALAAPVQTQLKKAFRQTGMESTARRLERKQIPPNKQILLRGTCVTFELDEKYFNDLAVSFDTRLLRQYLSDIAMTNPTLRVIFKDEKQNTEEEFYFKKGIEDILAQTASNYYKLSYHEVESDFKWEAFVMEGEGRTLSWINGNFASLGGSPIEYFSNRLCDEVRKKPSLVQTEKRLGVTITRTDVRKLFHVYHNMNLNAPRFKSQDKSYVINDLNAPIRRAVEQNLERLSKKINLLPRIIAECERRVKLSQLTAASKQLKRVARTYIEKLIPCSSKTPPAQRVLFLAEGDSAVAGLRSVRDPVKHALFPLRGKPLNVKGLSLGRVLQNEEFKNIAAILSLPLETKIKSLAELNYHRICIVTDADYDGYAIRSLILNFFFEYWKELFMLGAIYLVEAPLYEVELRNPRKEKKLFYCVNDNEFTALMKKATRENCKLVRKKRNKGLGETSPAAMQYAISHNLIPIALAELPQAQRVQKLWFAKDEAAGRRVEISTYAQIFLEE